ncbi:MAG: hypothetical protein HY043_18865 [Verrucomicrobia bacterium]|nr:hypothetical protein [Verrucomicrobiota bacterium]
MKTSITPTIERRLGFSFAIDTNQINARHRLPNMTQLEKWRRDGVILLVISEPAFDEIAKGNDQKRRSKASDYLRAKHRIRSQEDLNELRTIERILFPRGANTQSEKTDAEIVLNAKKNFDYLITRDGNSKSQPRGILGSRADLRKLGVTVMTDKEAVDFIRKHIELRDNNARLDFAILQLPPPDWIGKD